MSEGYRPESTLRQKQYPGWRFGQCHRSTRLWRSLQFSQDLKKAVVTIFLKFCNLSRAVFTIHFVVYRKAANRVEINGRAGEGLCPSNAGSRAERSCSSMEKVFHILHSFLCVVTVWRELITRSPLFLPPLKSPFVRFHFVSWNRFFFRFLFSVLLIFWCSWRWYFFLIYIGFLLHNVCFLRACLVFFCGFLRFEVEVGMFRFPDEKFYSAW